MYKRIKIFGSSSILLLIVSMFVLGINVPWAKAVVSTNYELVSQRPAGSAYTAGASLRGSSHSVSGDGRYILFTSTANDLVSGDTNNLEDVFVRDTITNTTTRVNVSSSGVQANSYGYEAPSISYDGRFVVFSSTANTLAPGVTGTSKMHAYIRDLSTNTTSLIDTSANGVLNDGQAYSPEISADGRFVVFSALSANLVPSINSPLVSQIYMKDTHTGAIKILSVTSTGLQSNGDNNQPDVSCDGNIVTFMSTARNLGVPNQPSRADLMIVSLGWSGQELSNVTSYSSYGIDGSPSADPQISCDGNNVIFTSSSADIVTPAISSTNLNIYQYKRLSGTMKQVSLGSGNVQSDTFQQYKPIAASMSGDGRYVAFSNYAHNMDSTYPLGTDSGSEVSIYIRDMKNSTTETVTKLPSGSRSAWASQTVGISPDGTVVAFGHRTPSIYNSSRALGSSFTTNTTNDAFDIYKTDTGH